MPAFTNIANALVAVGAKPFATTMQALRDNPLAIAEGDPTAPVNTSAWHPYNKLINNDANTGLIWSFPVNGAQATVTTPDFVNGWEYALLFDQVRSSNGAAGSISLNLFRETAGAYAGTFVMSAGTTVTSAQSASPWIELPHMRKVRRSHMPIAYNINADAGDAVGAGLVPYVGRTSHATAQRILRAQISITGAAGDITGSGSTGAIFLYRRKDSGSQ